MSLAVRDYTLFPNILISTFAESVCGRPLNGRSGLKLDGVKSSFPWDMFLHRSAHLDKELYA